MWETIPIKDKELNLHRTLNGGQSFRWWQVKATENTTEEWTGVFSQTAWQLKQCDNKLHYIVLGSLHKNDSQEDKAVFRKFLEIYFRLNVNLNELYEEWSSKDELFKVVSQNCYGLRLLDQDPVENIFSSICSLKNNVRRISAMVERMCSTYGDLICSVNGRSYYAFPTIKQLSGPEVGSKLEKLGLGYRAHNVYSTAVFLTQVGGVEWIYKLVDMKYADAKKQLLNIKGMGPKVVDTVCLMSLNHLKAVPVDSYVCQIAAHNYLPHLKGKKDVTRSMYTEIANHFRSLFGEKAGWALSILCCAESKEIVLPNDNKQNKNEDQNVYETEIDVTEHEIKVEAQETDEDEKEHKTTVKRKLEVELELDEREHNKNAKIKEKALVMGKDVTKHETIVKVKVEPLETELDVMEHDKVDKIKVEPEFDSAKIKAEPLELDVKGNDAVVKIKAEPEFEETEYDTIKIKLEPSVPEHNVTENQKIVEIELEGPIQDFDVKNVVITEVKQQVETNRSGNRKS